MTAGADGARADDRAAAVPAEAQVTLANWQEPPFNRWAFQHVRELIPTARISRGAGPARHAAASRARPVGAFTFR